MFSPLASLRNALASAVASSQGLSSDSEAAVYAHIREADPQHGDLSLPCFPFAKTAGKKPPELARAWAADLAGDPRWSVEAVGPYLNFSFSAAALAELVVPAARGPDFVRSEHGQNRTMVIDFSSPNIAKPLAFHHIRSTVIGAALSRIHAACGWKVVSINYFGDWGKQFGLLATGFARHGDPARREDAKHLVEVYVRASKEADVAGRKARIARPAEAEGLAEALRMARAEAEAAEGKDVKKAEKRAKGLERKLRALGDLAADVDPLEALPSLLQTLRADAEIAKGELPEAEAKDAEARRFLRRMEEKDEAALAEWRRFRAISIEDFEKVYARLGVRFSSLEGESLYQDVLEETVEKVRHQPGTRVDQGAEVVDVDVPADEPPPMLKTRDGTTLYLTRDVAAALDRHARFDFDRALYVVGVEQSLHFKQLFTVLKAMGHDWADSCHHVPFGRVIGMSTRRGNVVFLDEVLEESVSKARAICEASDKIDSNLLDEVVEAIGIGAILYGDLKNLRASDFNFDWDEVLQFTGFTGPYVQFSHARACSILRKGEDEGLDEAVLSRLELDEERMVFRALARFPDVLQRACEEFEPSLLARATFDLAQATASWFTAGNQDRSKRVLVGGDPELRRARLALVDAVRRTLAAGLELLGLQAPQAM